jgi:hypothetical protein
MHPDIRGIINDISIYSILLPLLLGFIFLKKLSRDSLIVWGIVTLGSIPELLGQFTTDTLTRNIAYNLYTPFEFAMLWVLYRDKFRSRLNRRIFRTTVRIYIGLSLLIVWYFGMAARFINEWVCVNNIIYTAWTLMVLAEEFSSEEGMRLNFQLPFFWYITAYFFYAPCTLLLYSLWHFIKQNPDSPLDNIWIIHNVFNTCLYVFFTVGFVKDVLGRKLRDEAKKESLDHANEWTL